MFDTDIIYQWNNDYNGHHDDGAIHVGGADDTNGIGGDPSDEENDSWRLHHCYIIAMKIQYRCDSSDISVFWMHPPLVCSRIFLKQQRNRTAFSIWLPMV